MSSYGGRACRCSGGSACGRTRSMTVHDVWGLSIWMGPSGRGPKWWKRWRRTCRELVYEWSLQWYRYSESRTRCLSAACMGEAWLMVVGRPARLGIPQLICCEEPEHGNGCDGFSSVQPQPSEAGRRIGGLEPRTSPSRWAGEELGKDILTRSRRRMESGMEPSPDLPRVSPSGVVQSGARPPSRRSGAGAF